MTVLIGSEGVCKVECVLMYLEAAAWTFELCFISSFASWSLSGDNSGFYMLAPPVHGRWSFTNRGSDSRTCRVKVARRQSSHRGEVDCFLCLELEEKSSFQDLGSRACFFWRFQSTLTGKKVNRFWGQEMPH